MTLLSLPEVRGVIEKGYQSMVFEPQNATPTKTRALIKSCIIVAKF